MAQPRPYVVTNNFNDYSTTNPSDQHPGSRFDTEFAEIKQNTDDLNSNISLLQRDDGKLSNQAVHKDSFDQDSLALIGLSGYTVKGAWVAATAYVSGDIVTYNQATYLTAAAHTSSSAFGTDLGATPPKWTLIANAGIDLEGAQVDIHDGLGVINLQGASWSDGAAVISFTSDIGTPVVGQFITHTAFPTGTKIASIQTSSQLTADTNATAAGSSQTVDLGRGFTLTFTYTSTTDIQVFVAGVLTLPSLYTVSGDTLTFTNAPGSGTDNVIVWGGSVSVEGTKATVLTYRDDTLDHRDTAQDYATRVGATVRHFDGASNNVSDTSPAAQSGVYSAKEHAEGTTVPEGSAKEWADKINGAVATTFSAKAYAQGGTGVDIVSGSAKDWATKATTPTSTATDASAREWAIGTSTHKGDVSAKFWASETGANAPSAGSAKEWATTDTAAVAGGLYSAKQYATNSAASASSAATDLATFQGIFRGASTSTPGSPTDGDLWFDTNTNVDLMKVYNSTASAWEQLTPTTVEQTAITAVNADAVDIGRVSGQISPTNNIATVAGDRDNINTVGTDLAGQFSYIDDHGLITEAVTGGSGVSNIQKVAAGTDGTSGTGGTTNNLALINTVALSIADINRYAQEYKISDDVPTSPTPTAGDLWYDGTNDILKFHNGTGFVAASEGDISGVTAGDGLTGGGTAGTVTITVVGGTGITANANDITIDSTVATLSGSQTLTNKSIVATQLTGTIADGRMPNLTGDVTTSEGAVATSISGLAVSKTLLAGGTGLTLATNTLNVDASQTQITSVGTIGTGVWQGTTIKTAYIGDDQVTEDKLANTLLAEIDANTAKVTNSTNASDLASGTVALARGGTGATAKTGTGNNVLATSPTLVTPDLGTPSAMMLDFGTI